MSDEIEKQDKPDLIVRFGNVFKVANEDQRIIEGYASTEDVDDFDDVIRATAFSNSLPRYAQHPGVTKNHDYSDSVGRSEVVEVHPGKGLWARIRISEAEPDLWTKIKEGIYNAFSISGKKVRSIPRPGSTRGGREYQEVDLHEIAVCWLPANRNARIDYVSRSLASAMSNGEINHTRFTNPPNEREGITMPPELDALTKTQISTEVGLMKTEIKEHLGEVYKTHADTKFSSLNQAITELTVIAKTVQDKAGTWVTKAEQQEFNDKIAKDIAPLAEFIQKQRNQQTLLPWAIETDDLSELMSRSNITHDEAKFCEEIGADPVIVRMQTCNPKHFSEGMGDGIAKWQDDAQEVAMIHCLLKNSSGYRDRGGIKSLKRYKRLRDTYEKIKKGVGMDTATAAEGTEWVPTIMSGEVIRRVENEAVVAGLFRRATMPSKAWDWPIVGAGAVGYVMPESTTDAVTALITSTVVGTSKVTFTAVKAAIFVPVSAELTEDAVAGGLSIITDEIVLGMTRNLENAIINSDSTNIGVAAANQDNDITGAYAIQKLFAAGLREKALAGTTVDGGANIIGTTVLRSLRKGLSGAKSVKPTDIAYIMSSKSYVNLLSDPNLLTMEKFGPMATLLTGFLAAVDGSPVVVSDYVRDDVAATGVNTAAGPNTLTTVLAVHRPSWAIGDRRMLTLKSDNHILTDSLHLVATWRGDFQPVLATTPATIAVNVLP